MSSRNWSSDVAIGGVAVATILICVAIANILSDRDRPSYRDYPEGYKQLAPSGEGVRHRRPPADRSICNQTDTEKEYELCQAWRAADGAREAADTAWKQFLISIIGLFGLGYTVYYTKQAAEGARKAAEVARDTLIASERAWIRRDRIIFALNLDFSNDGTLNSAIRFEFTNVGSAPAIHVNEFAWLIPVTRGLVPEEEAKRLFAVVRAHPVSSGFTLFPNQSYPRERDIPVTQSVFLTAEETAPATDAAGRISLYLAACINYSFGSDPMKNHQTSCLFEVGVPGFITRGGGVIPMGQLRLREIAGFGGMDLAD